MIWSTSDSTEMDRRLHRAVDGNHRAFARLFTPHRAHLERVVGMQLEPSVRTPVDSSDIVRETERDAFARLSDYLAQRPMPFGLWLRKIAQERLAEVHKRYRLSRRRPGNRETALPSYSLVALAKRTLGGPTGPRGVLRGQELVPSIRRAVAQLPRLDREILILRNVECLSDRETAYVLEIESATANLRLDRALLRLRRRLLVDMGRDAGDDRLVRQAHRFDQRFDQDPIMEPP